MRRKIDQVVDSDALTIRGRVIHPKLRIQGWEFGGTEQSGEWRGAQMQVAPVEVRVTEDDNESVIPITDPIRDVIRHMIVSSLTLSGICMAVMLLAWLRRRA